MWGRNQPNPLHWKTSFIYLNKSKSVSYIPRNMKWNKYVCKGRNENIPFYDICFVPTTVKQSIAAAVHSRNFHPVCIPKQHGSTGYNQFQVLARSHERESPLTQKYGTQVLLELREPSHYLLAADTCAKSTLAFSLNPPHAVEKVHPMEYSIWYLQTFVCRSYLPDFIY